MVDLASICRFSFNRSIFSTITRPEPYKVNLCVLSMSKDAVLRQELDDLSDIVYDLIRDIRDPEKDNTLEELDVVYESGVHVEPWGEDKFHISIEFTPTVPHCSLATLIGLCLRVKLENNLPQHYKLDITVKEGTHSTGPEINKQINDKERIAAAMENPDLRAVVNKCVQDPE
uniref:Cytosolic iron-sulfur assembly component 2A n=1 Tax=Branchiostoma floridae TaxID=7739 RepID=C3Y1R3_BRAFL|eukprot:XP_002609793.1 hypothetical protein BRAFLDRAFT_280326 [Branchiostoma floridae]